MTTVLEESLREQLRKRRAAELERVARLSMWRAERPTLMGRVMAWLRGWR